jgi:hypothetical protein
VKAIEKATGRKKGGKLPTMESVKTSRFGTCPPGSYRSRLHLCHSCPGGYWSPGGITPECGKCPAGGHVLTMPPASPYVPCSYNVFIIFCRLCFASKKQQMVFWFGNQAGGASLVPPVWSAVAYALLAGSRSLVPRLTRRAAAWCPCTARPRSPQRRLPTTRRPPSCPARITHTGVTKGPVGCAGWYPPRIQTTGLPRLASSATARVPCTSACLGASSRTRLTSALGSPTSRPRPSSRSGRVPGRAGRAGGGGRGLRHPTAQVGRYKTTNQAEKQRTAGNPCIMHTRTRHLSLVWYLL